MVHHILFGVIAATCILFTYAAIDEVEVQFVSFIKKHNRGYVPASSEYLYRLSIFRRNLDIADYYNTLEGNTIYGTTKYMDMSQEEFKHYYLLNNRGGSIPDNQDKVVAPVSVQDVPTRFDWRDKNAVTPVYDQGQCGSCWAFSATEAIESQWFLSGHKLVNLSPQQIVDCDQGRGDQGCNGGDTPTAYAYVIAAGGMDTMSSYPYTGSDDTCAFKSADVAAMITGFTYASKTKNETEMQQQLLAKGPISICVDAEPWQFYVGGVVSSFCPDSLDHCVLLTGYDDAYVDVLGQTVQIWKIRNSWGADWGESGYIYIERGYNLCGLADEPTIPVV